jgi:hypothetical protein
MWAPSSDLQLYSWLADMRVKVRATESCSGLDKDSLNKIDADADAREHVIILALQGQYGKSAALEGRASPSPNCTQASDFSSSRREYNEALDLLERRLKIKP